MYNAIYLGVFRFITMGFATVAVFITGVEKRRIRG